MVKVVEKLVIGLLLVGVAVLVTYHYKASVVGILGMFSDKTNRQVIGTNDEPAYHLEVVAAPGQELKMVPDNSSSGVYKTTVLVISDRPLKVNSSVPLGTDFPLAGAPKVEKLVKVSNTSDGKKEYLYEISLKVRVQNESKVQGFIGGHFVYLTADKGTVGSSTSGSSSPIAKPITKVFQVNSSDEIIRFGFYPAQGVADGRSVTLEYFSPSGEVLKNGTLYQLSVNDSLTIANITDGASIQLNFPLNTTLKQDVEYYVQIEIGNLSSGTIVANYTIPVPLDEYKSVVFCFDKTTTVNSMSSQFVANLEEPDPVSGVIFSDAEGGPLLKLGVILVPRG